ncbi:MAG: TetR family transcriptional regulator, partial [Phenylobacterium sp.]|nr:TetR family transcriptional regulator [Phenylobacterium sp.]
LGITKSALYYYFRSKEDLVYKSYLRTCQVWIRAVEGAAGRGGAGRERFEAYVRSRLSVDNPPVAFVGEIDFLAPSHRNEIFALERRHDHALRGLLSEGVADGSLTMPDVGVVNHSVIGALNWILVWLRPGKGEMTPDIIGEAFLDLFLNGLARSGRRSAADLPPPVRLMEPPPVAAFDRIEQAARRREALVRSGSEFFNRNGFDNCTLEDVVNGLGISKSALYHYVSSKEALLHAAYDRSLEKTELVMTTIDDDPGDGLAKIMRTIASAVDLHVGPAGPIANYTRLKSLTPEHGREVHARSERLEAILSGFFDLGVADGSVRRIDTHLARLALLGAINSLPKWYAPGARVDADAVTANLVHLFINGLVPRKG